MKDFKIATCQSKETNHTASTSGFKPIVASSLALLLSAGFAHAAAAIQNCNSSGSFPKLCYSINGGAATDFSGITWQAVSGTNGIFQPKNGNTVLTEILFEFNRGNGNNKPSIAVSGEKATIHTGTNRNPQSLIIDGGSNGIQIGDGTGTLKIDFKGGVGTNTKRQFDLNLSQVNKSFAFKGNLYIVAGIGEGTSRDKNSTFAGVFAKDMIGNIFIDAHRQGNNRGHHTELTFANASLKGNLTTRGGNTNATFSNGVIGGNVLTEGFSRDSSAVTTLSFSGTSSKLVGKLTATSVGSQHADGTATNIVTLHRAEPSRVVSSPQVRPILSYTMLELPSSKAVCAQKQALGA